MQSIQWDPALIAKYNINGPRYTSYPTALALQAPFDSQIVRQTLQSSSGELSLYLHLPFCHQLCYYCGCNKVITRHQHKADRYLDALAQEMALYQPWVAHRSIGQIHLGGGTPTFLTEQQLSRLMRLFQQHFDCSQLDELSIEIDPRSCSLEKLAHLRKLGFNRVSFGVQDFDQQVQITINRVQDADLIRQLVEGSKTLGFRSVNLDLVYGLPYQQAGSFAETLAQVVALDPDRISLFSYAHLPERFAAQRKIPDAALPAASTKLKLLQLGIETFSTAGYQFIGMDHFAKPGDGLAQAQRDGRLQRNFQGYTTHGQNALLGLGVSSISQVDGVLWQHEKDLPDYYQAIDAGHLPLAKGVVLSKDDRIRAELIAQLICHFELDIVAFASKWQLDFARYFADSLPQLAPFIEDGLLELTSGHIRIREAGRLWVRSICSAFDVYLQQGQQRYSKVV
ncbi:oxygen-independent coproporphyrinogen III oxidase [Alkalimonas collagenimarina]|uniref:Coproporphyrinogen-III oxidase n=1 Tax=Alkalimonas collagenimarina TaxID=400390 RepID=A0ABT9GXK3_9GAMM|nr:oxygen-independent coproporphyrinogen III oxidase [Alkalimonas collagenimarina]MDP4535788.1 oxygen-independent coproporphyrinogen III oxidase [Alkalimonas collagenimarina]